MKIWKITFKDGTSQQANNYYHLSHGEHEYIIKEKVMEEEEIVTDILWWKKKTKIFKTELYGILVIPTENVLKAELIEVEDMK